MTQSLPGARPAQDPLPSRSSRSADELVQENLPLVGYLVSEMITRVPDHVSRDDLTSAGLTALVQAARSYDEAREVPFGRYASARIRGALVDELRSHDWASRSVRYRARRRDAAVDELAVLLGRVPTSAEIADHLGVDVSEVDQVDGDVQRAIVLSLQGFADPGVLDEIAPAGDDGADQHVLAAERIGYLHDAVAVLPDRLKAVVVGYFFQERRMGEIAEELGVTESRVSQMRAEALAMLRDALDAHLSPEKATQPARPGSAAARRREAYYAAVAAHSDFRTRVAARPLEPMPVAATRSA